MDYESEFELDGAREEDGERESVRVVGMLSQLEIVLFTHQV